MRNPQGYGVISDPNLSQVIEHDTFTCRHCNRVVIVPPPFNGQAMPGGFCHGCSGFMCEDCTKARELGGPCVTWQQQLDQIEAKQNALRSYGLI